MRAYTTNPANKSRTLDSNPIASKQASLAVILQQYKQNIQQHASRGNKEGIQDKFDGTRPETIGEELLQRKFEFVASNEQEYLQQEEKSSQRGLPDNPNNKLKTIRTTNTTVQRRVGFEYEIGDINTQKKAWYGTWKKHSKGDILEEFPGYDLTADEADGASDLEVIIHHIDETMEASPCG